ncbi:hypothetical protein [Rhizobium sp. CSW-27]|uniref:hypothetical protein n=1 Tax=Rhizobium sp. CSW-27 TaxID=2839985 RepID=UPI001C0170D4|nr:hypothetical protein [Rhizobium sp. CSW-27]MBT9370262.1 hypothetical protein [Rhizobium sp. CSW-27]
MKESNYEAARHEYSVLKLARVELRNAVSDIDALRSWEDILTRCGRIYNKLDGGASGKSQQWWGRKRTERKKDELLRYAHHARNADTHGIAPIAAPSKAIVLTASDQGGGWINSFWVGQNGEITLDVKDGNGRPIDPRGFVAINRWGLIEVTDSGKNYPAPRSHLGQPIDPNNIITVVDLLHAYMGKMVEEAEALLKR